MSTELSSGPPGEGRSGAGPFGEAASERRSLSVLFADLVGSTDHMERLGAEDYADLVRRFHGICTQAVRRRGGTVAQYQGDGIIVYFGWPHAAEDDPVRAVKAALDIQAALAGMAGSGRAAGHPSAPDAALSTRIGISTGPALIRSDGKDFGANAVGTCINRAARLEALAEPGTVLICDDTRRLVGELFQTRDLGARELKGLRGAQRVHRVDRRRSGVTTRFAALRGGGRAGLIGRDHELKTLHRHFGLAAEGKGRALVIAADPGLGKSSLVAEFLRSEALSHAASFVLQCSPEHTGTPLHPIRSYLEWVAGVGAADGDAARHAKLERLFSAVWGAEGEELAMLLDLLSPLGPGIELDRSDSIPLQRQRAFSVLCRMIFRSGATRGAMIVVFEDVHWIDPSTAQLLQCMVSNVSGQPALALLTTRQEPPFGEGMEGAAELVTLQRLGEDEAAALARRSLGEDGLDASQVALIIEKSDGVPLYIEEYGDMLRGTGGRVPTETGVPLTLGALVQGKLDRLALDVRRFAQAGSALGRSFDPRLVARLCGSPEADVPALSAALAENRLVMRGAPGGGEAMVTFAHALIRDAIYGSLARDQRQRLHGAIAEAFLAEDAGAVVDDHVLADHLARAGRPVEAIERYFSAALKAAGKGAAGEALAHLEAALAALEALPAGPERDGLELRIRAVQGPTQMVTRGPGNPAFGTTQDRAMELLDRLDLHGAMVPVIYNTALHAWATADLGRAMAISESIARIHDAAPGDAAFMAAHTMRGLVAWHQGRNGLAETCLAATVGRHDPALHRDLYSVFLKEFGVFSLFYLALTRTVRGDLADGAALADRAAALGAEMGFPHARGFGMLARFNCAMFRGDADLAAEQSAAAVEFATRQGFPEFAAMGRFVGGWAMVRRGQPDEGIARMGAGLAQWAATGFTCWQALFAAFLACDLARAGRTAEATRLTGDYIALIDRTGEDQTRAPLLLARAEILAAEGDRAGAAALAVRARETAIAQGAQLWLGMVDARFPA